MPDSEITIIARATTTALRQHMRLRPGGGGAALTIALEDLGIIVASRTGLAVGYEEIRNLVDALVGAGILDRSPGPVFMASTYAFTSSGAALNARIGQFLACYRPHWEPFSKSLHPIAAGVARYEALFRARVGGLPRAPDLPEVARSARLNGGVLWLDRLCRGLEERTKRRC